MLRFQSLIKSKLVGKIIVEGNNFHYLEKNLSMEMNF